MKHKIDTAPPLGYYNYRKLHKRSVALPSNTTNFPPVDMWYDDPDLSTNDATDGSHYHDKLSQAPIGTSDQSKLESPNEYVEPQLQVFRYELPRLHF